MRKLARLISAVALTLAIIICFSGCGIVDYAKSILQKDNSEVSANLGNTDPTDNSVEQNNNDVTNNATVVLPGTTNGTTSSAGQSTNNTTSNKKPTSNNSQTKPPVADKQEDNKLPETDAPTTEEITEEEIEDLTVKEIQDLLFATKDPNTAGKILTIAGFEYDEKQGIYYSQMNPLQRKFGFNLVYDMAAPMAGMVYDTKRIEFVYDEREWMVQIWKGQYGITSGAEIGLYNRDPERNFQYDCADDEDLIEMHFDFYNMNEFVFSRGPEKHWWLTGFKVFHTGVPMLIDLDMTLKFTDNQMADAFYKSLKKMVSGSVADNLIDPITYSRKGSTVYIKW